MCFSEDFCLVTLLETPFENELVAPLKPQDLFILYHALVCKSQNLPIQFRALSKKKWTEVEIKASQRRLQHLGLINAKSSVPNLDRTRLFLMEAVSFWWPAQKTKSTTKIGHIHCRK